MRHLATAFLALVTLSVAAAAHGSFVTTWQALYPNSTTDDHVLNGTGSSCQVCHWGPNGGPAWNAYGWSVRENINAGDSLIDAITHAESANPDADPLGAASLIEIGSGTQPGWTPGPNNTQFTPTNQNPGLTPPAAILGSLDPGSALLVYCSPGSAGVSACPCGNAPAAAGLGCDNSDATGGASITALGLPSLAADTIVIATAGQKASATSVLLQGTTSNPNGVVFGQGVRCVAGSLKRLYVRAAVGGSVSLPAAGDPSISARSAALGDLLGAGSQREYMVYYRDPAVLGGCPATSTFNATSSGTLVWLP